MRVVVSLVFTVITTVWFFLSFDVFYRWLNKKYESTLVKKYLIEKIRHWKYWCFLLGYLIMTGNGPGEGLSYTLPMALYNMGSDIYFAVVELLVMPLAAATVFRVFWWLKTLKYFSLSLVLSHHAHYIGVGMLIGQAVEWIARFIGSWS